MRTGLENFTTQSPLQSYYSRTNNSNMVHTAQLVLVFSVVAAGFMLVTQAGSAPPATSVNIRKEPTILTLMDPAQEAATTAKATATMDTGDDTTTTAGGVGLFANNKIQIQDSRIVLTARDRKNLLDAIAAAMVADHGKAMTASAATGDSTMATTLLPLNRDAFLYLLDNGVVRLGWRYPLATWGIYKDYMATQNCDVNRVIGDSFYC